MSPYKLSLLIFILTLSACSTFVGLFEQESSENFIPIEKSGLTCKRPPKNTFISKNQKANWVFKKIITEVEKERRLSFIEKGILFSLFQMRVNPLQATPQARLQVIVYQKGKLSSFDFNNLIGDKAKLSSPFIQGLSSLLKKYHSRYSLKILAKMIDDRPNFLLPVSSLIAESLRNNINQLEKDPVLLKNYFKGTSTLMTGESIPLFSLQAVVKKVAPLTKDKVFFENTLFPYKDQNSSSHDIFCNKDLGLYQNQIYLPQEGNTYSPHTFALTNQKGDIFLGISDLNLQVRSWKKTPLFSGSNQRFVAPFCFIKNKNSGTTLLISSTKSRDPGQTLFNLLNYQIYESTGAEELELLLKFPRHQMIPNPPRLFLESKRTTQKQLEEFLMLGIPIYHQRNMGEVWAFWDSNGLDQGWGFTLDERYKNYSTCKSP